MPERLIDKAKLLEYLAAIKPDEYVSAYGEAAVDVINHVETYVSEMPIIEAEPVWHGRLIKTHLKGYYKCSACMFACTSNPDQRFCSYCGAKLDGGVEDG